MSSLSPTVSARGLPVLAGHEAEVIGNQILRTLDRLGFIHENRDGTEFGICFSQAVLLCDELALYTVDAEKMWHYSVAEIFNKRVISQLQAVTGRPVWGVRSPKPVFVVDLKPRATAGRLPKRVELDLGRRPAGELLTPVGVGADGPVWLALPDIGHALIAGETGSGKSTFVHAALAALLTCNDPERLQVALIGPKRAEFAAWLGAPHVWDGQDLAGDPKSAEGLLHDLLAEVDRRDRLCAGALVRDVRGYNAISREKLPTILIIADELVDLALQAGSRSKLMDYFAQIASKARAYGVYLWVIAQHPKFDVVPSVVTRNMGSRFCFRVIGADVASRMMRCPGADEIGRDAPGRMVARLGKPVKVQGYWLSDEAIVAAARGLGGTVGEGDGNGHLPEAQAALVRYALEHLGGAFIKNQLGGAFPLDHPQYPWGGYRIGQLAAEWERRGWLTRPRHRADPRWVTEKLREMVSS